MKCRAPKAALFAAPFLALTLSAALATTAGAEVISFQDPDTGDMAYIAQVYEDAYSEFNTYEIDDLDLGPAGFCLESVVTYWRVGIVEPQYYRIRTYSDLPHRADINEYFIKEYSGVAGEYDAEGRWMVTFDLGGDVYSGVIWIAGYVRADYEGDGQDGWCNANAGNLGYEPNGSEEYVWYWGTGWMGPVPGSTFHLETADMSWKIEGTPVPEPALVSFFVLALSGGYLWRTQAGR